MGNKLPGFPLDTHGSLLQNAPTIGDIDNDGNNELVAGSGIGMLFAWESDGKPVKTFPRLVTDRILSTATLTDLDKDGTIDIAVGQNDSQFFVFDLPSTYHPESIEWGMYRHDPQGSGSSLVAPTLNKVYLPKVLYAADNDTLTVPLSYNNPDNLTYWIRVRQSPEGSNFNVFTNTFTWTPTIDQAGKDFKFYFFITDGIRQNHIPVEIKVKHSRTNISLIYNSMDYWNDFYINESIKFRIHATDEDGLKKLWWFTTKFYEEDNEYVYYGDAVPSAHSDNLNGTTYYTTEGTVSIPEPGKYQIKTITIDTIIKENKAAVCDINVVKGLTRLDIDGSLNNKITVNKNETISLKIYAADIDGVKRVWWNVKKKNPDTGEYEYVGAIGNNTHDFDGTNNEVIIDDTLTLNKSGEYNVQAYTHDTLWSNQLSSEHTTGSLVQKIKVLE